MKSILYQLQKYQGPEEPKNEIVVHEASTPTDDRWQLACNIVTIDWPSTSPAWEAKVRRVYNLLADMPESSFCGTLFSREILGIYHCYYHHGVQVLNESQTDEFFCKFLRQVDLRKYQNDFEKAVDETSKRLAVIRIALATSCENGVMVTMHSTTHEYHPPKKEDRLPKEFRQPAYDYLGVDSISEAAKLQDRMNKSATLDQIILGRMGYFMFWYWNDRGEKSNVPLLTAPVIYLPAP
jgi:hypothetical protein